MTLRLTGFSKRENKEVTLILFDSKIWKSIDDIDYFFDPDTVIQLREYNTGILTEEMKVSVLKDKIK